MNLTRRSVAKGLGMGSLVAAATALFPEVATAKTNSTSLAASRGLISVAKSDPRVAAVLALYADHTFRWDEATAAVGQRYAWVMVIGQRRVRGSVAYVTALIDRKTRAAVLVEHAHVTPHTQAGPGGASVTLAFGSQAPVWMGVATSSGTMVVDSSCC